MKFKAGDKVRWIRGINGAFLKEINIIAKVEEIGTSCRLYFNEDSVAKDWKNFGWTYIYGDYKYNNFELVESAEPSVTKNEGTGWGFEK